MHPDRKRTRQAKKGKKSLTNVRGEAFANRYAACPIVTQRNCEEQAAHYNLPHAAIVQWIERVPPKR